MKIKFLAAATLLFVSGVSQAFVVGATSGASTNGTGWVGATAPSQVIANSTGTPGVNEWFSRYTTGNGDSKFDINAGILNSFKTAPLQDQNGAGLIAASNKVKVTFLGTGAARDSNLFVAQVGASTLNVGNFWNPVYASGGTNNLGSFNPVNAGNQLFETRGGCTYADAKNGNTCVPSNLGQTREITGLNVGDNLIFGLQALVLHYNADNIHYPNVNYFFSGAASNNTDPNHWDDGLIHTKVLNLGSNNYLVGFEDTWGGGDRDYNDNIFLFQGVNSTIVIPPVNVPEPSSIALLALGALLLARRKQQA